MGLRTDTMGNIIEKFLKYLFIDNKYLFDKIIVQLFVHVLLFAFGLSAKLMPKALELLF
jgi:hypothetical protein